MTKVTKAIIPAAGLGTRMLPATKTVPKELIPILDKPVIQYVVEEAVAAGIKEILIIISEDKLAIRDHFQKNELLEDFLLEKNKTALLGEIRKLHELAQISFVFQKERNGLGDAIRYGKAFVGADPFAVLLGDTIITTEQQTSLIGQLITIYDQVESGVVALEAVAKDQVHRYGVIDGIAIGQDLFKIKNLIEKPSIEKAPSNLVIASRYVLTPAIFDVLERIPRGYNNELQLTDAMRVLLDDRDLYGLKFRGTRHDVGNQLGFVKTNILFGLKHQEFGATLKNWIKTLE